MIYVALIITSLSLILALNMFGLTGSLVNRLLENFRTMDPPLEYWER